MNFFKHYTFGHFSSINKKGKARADTSEYCGTF